MRPRLAVAAATVAVCACVARPACAQEAARRDWNSAAALDLVARAIGRRTAQLADTGLTDYKATAHGYVTFLAQLGEGFRDPPQVVRADELAVEVYWRAPNQSKQRVVGRRSELEKPTDIAYHRDHLAVVQNNFPAIIRLGDGDEVRDVPHPLSPVGRSEYDFAIADSLALRVGPRTWDVITVEFRPRNDRLARAVGAVYLDRETATVVRLSITFTRAALIDPALEDVSVTLDNGLVDGRFWLPRRQEIEIRRTGTWLEFPARGIIRGTWDLCCVETNRNPPPALFTGPEIAFASPAELAAYPFAGRLRDSIPGLAESAFGDRAAELVQRRAAALVREEALRRLARPRLAGAAVSDFVRVNRVEGLAVGSRATVPLGHALTLRGGVRYGVDDRRGKFDIALAVPLRGGAQLGIAGFDTHREVGVAAEASTLGNSIAAQEFGDDVTDEYRAAGIAATLAGGGRVRWRLGAERVSESSLVVHAQPFSGSYRAAFPAARLTATYGFAEVNSRGAELRGWRVDWTAGLRVADAGARPWWGTGTVDLDATRHVGDVAVALRALARATTGDAVPAQSRAFFGGPISAPGYPVHSIAGASGAAVRAEAAKSLFGYALPLGRFGNPRTDVKLVPFAGAARGDDGWRRYAGIGVLTLYDVVRFDVARGLDRGGGWSVRLDFSRAYWPIL